VLEEVREALLSADAIEAVRTNRDREDEEHKGESRVIYVRGQDIGADLRVAFDTALATLNPSEGEPADEAETYPLHCWIEGVDGYLRVMPPADWIDFEGRVHYVPAHPPGAPCAECGTGKQPDPEPEKCPTCGSDDPSTWRKFQPHGQQTHVRLSIHSGAPFCPDSFHPQRSKVHQAELDRREGLPPDPEEGREPEGTVVVYGDDQTYESALSGISHLLHAANPGQTVAVERNHVDQDGCWFTVTVKPYASAVQVPDSNQKRGGTDG
jgi:hypothetical protein